jgi:5-methylthioadenosine/S-adenosylhomocysteine deaminase
VLRLMAMMQKDRHHDPEVMPIPEALYIAFRESAAMIEMASPQMTDKLGAVEAGYLADLILVDLSGIHHQPLHSITTSLVYNMQSADVRTVIVDGRVVMRDRQLLTLDEGEIVMQVKQSMARLAKLQPNNRIQVYNP